VVQSVLRTSEEELYLENGDHSDPGFISKRDLFVAFAGGLPSEQTLKELCDKFEKSLSFINTYCENILEKFSRISSQVES
jgi:hypothetical protein